MNFIMYQQHLQSEPLKTKFVGDLSMNEMLMVQKSNVGVFSEPRDKYRGLEKSELKMTKSKI